MIKFYPAHDLLAGFLMQHNDVLVLVVHEKIGKGIRIPETWNGNEWNLCSLVQSCRMCYLGSPVLQETCFLLCNAEYLDEIGSS